METKTTPVSSNHILNKVALVLVTAFATVALSLSAGHTTAFADTTNGTYAPAAITGANQGTVAVYRLYNMFNGEHLLTSDVNEKNVLVNRYDWLYEGTAFTAPASSSTKVYRVYNRYSGEHHYTTDYREVSVLTSRHGWNYEGVAWYSDDSKRVAVHRLYLPRVTFGHLFTTDTNERDVLARSHGWRTEGIGWYAVALGVSAGPHTYKYAHWSPLLRNCPATGWTRVTNGSITTAQRDALNRLSSGATTGFIALNTKTGKMVSRNPDMRQFSASTMKAIYIAALCKYNAPGIAAWGSRIRTIITYSDNALYHQIGATYGKGYLNRIASAAGVSLDLRYNTCYADVTPRELARLWTVVTQYLRSNEVNSNMFRNAFGQGGYYKEGWMFSTSSYGQMYNIVGVDGDVIYAIMSKYRYQSGAFWDLRNTLISATR